MFFFHVISKVCIFVKIETKIRNEGWSFFFCEMLSKESV